MHMCYYYVVKKLGCTCRYSVYIYRRSGSNYSLQLKYLQKAQTAVLTSTSCDKLLVAVTQCMTELAAGRVYAATPCTLLVYYNEQVTEQLDFPCTTHLWLHHRYMYHAYTITSLPYTKSGIFPVYPQMESVSANNCRSVFASSTQPAKKLLTVTDAVRRLLALESGS